MDMTTSFPFGKSIFIWKVKEVHAGNDDPAGLAKIAKAMGFSSVLVKIASGLDRYNLRPTLLGYQDNIMKPLVDAFHFEGLEVWGWQYVYGTNPTGEADVAIERVKTLGVDGFIIDAEKEYKAAGMANAALAYLTRLRSGLPDISIGLSTYRYPTLHREFPWGAFMPAVDFYVPQVYWVQANNPGEQLERSLNEYADLEKEIGSGPKPYIPTGAAYREFLTRADGTAYSWEPTLAQIVEFHEKAKALGLPGESFWEWGSAIRYGFEDSVGALQWDTPQPEPADPLAELKARFEALSDLYYTFTAAQAERNAYLTKIINDLAELHNRFVEQQTQDNASFKARLGTLEQLEPRITKWKDAPL